MDRQPTPAKIIQIPPSDSILLPGNAALRSDIVVPSDGAAPGLPQPRILLVPRGIPLLPAGDVVPDAARFGRYRRIAARLPTYLADAVENPS